MIVRREACLRLAGLLAALGGSSLLACSTGKIGDYADGGGTAQGSQTAASTGSVSATATLATSSSGGSASSTGGLSVGSGSSGNGAGSSSSGGQGKTTGTVADSGPVCWHPDAPYDCRQPGCGCAGPNLQCRSSDGACVACETDGQCLEPALPFCEGDAGACVACLTSNACRADGGGAFCGAHQACVYCLADSDCGPGEASRCETNSNHPAYGRCMPCTANAPACAVAQQGWENPSFSLPTVTGPFVCDTASDLCHADCLAAADAGILCQNQGVCDPFTRACALCRVNGDCAGTPTTPICSGGLCVGCETNLNCATAVNAYQQPLPVCQGDSSQPGYQTCVQCQRPADCDASRGFVCWPGGFVADGGPLASSPGLPFFPGQSPQCELDCRTDAGSTVCGYGVAGETTGFNTCDPSSGFCVACLRDADCGPSDGGTPFCDPLRKTCVQCRSRLDCPAGTGVAIGDNCNHGFCGNCLTAADCPEGEICGGVAVDYAGSGFGPATAGNNFCTCASNAGCGDNNAVCVQETGAQQFPELDGGYNGLCLPAGVTW